MATTKKGARMERTKQLAERETIPDLLQKLFQQISNKLEVLDTKLTAFEKRIDERL